MTKPQDTRTSRYRRLLRRAEQDPRSALEDTRCAKPDFCRDFLDLCDSQPWSDVKTARVYLDVATKLARRTEDSHLEVRSLGVEATATLVWDLDAGIGALVHYLREAELCCEECVSDAQRRTAEAMIRLGEPERAVCHLLPALHRGMDLRYLARIELVTALAAHQAGYGAQAVACLGLALDHMPLDASPRELVDAVALVGRIAAGRTPICEREALAHLQRFKKRIRGLRSDHGGKQVRLHVSWIEGLLYARLDDPRRAYNRLDSARQGFLKLPAPRQAVAVTLDQARLVHDLSGYADVQIRTVPQLLGSCLRQLELDKRLRRRLERLQHVVARTPEKAAKKIIEIRSSLGIPLPSPQVPSSVDESSPAPVSALDLSGPAAI